MKTLKFLITFALLITFIRVHAQEATATTFVNNMFTAYLDVKNALVATDNSAAKNKAGLLLATINTVSSAKFSPEQQKLWMIYADKIKLDSKNINESNRIEQQRDYFMSLSKSMAALLKSIRLNTSAIYEQYCPMKKATWLSETTSIKNPYFGGKMLTCGNTTIIPWLRL